MDGEDRNATLILMVVLVIVAMIIFVVFAIISSKEEGFSLSIFGSYAKALIGLFK